MKMPLWKFRLIISTLSWCGALLGQEHIQVSFLNTDSFDAYVTIPSPSPTQALTYTVPRYGVTPLTLFIPLHTRITVKSTGAGAISLPPLTYNACFHISAPITSEQQGRRMIAVNPCPAVRTMPTLEK